MNLTFAAQLRKMINAGLGGDVEAPETGVAVGRTTEYTDLGPVAIASFETNVEAPLRALSVALEPIQDLHGQAAPYPPGGSKNLFDPSANPDKWIGADGELTNVTGAKASQKIYTNGTVATFTISTGDDQTSILCIAGYAADDALIARSANNGVKYMTFTTTEEMAYIVAAIYTLHPVQLESGSTATGYVPYSNICPITGHDEANIWRDAEHDTTAEPTITIDFGESVYKGLLNVAAGLLRIDMAMVDMGSQTWSKNVYINTAFNLSLSASVKGISGRKTGALCSSYSEQQTQGVSGVQNGSFIVANNATLYVFRDDRYTSAADFKAAVSGVELCYVLAEPIEITLDPEEIKTLIGQNYVWSDAGYVSLTYAKIRYTEGY